MTSTETQSNGNCFEFDPEFINFVTNSGNKIGKMSIDVKCLDPPPNFNSNPEFQEFLRLEEEGLEIIQASKLQQQFKDGKSFSVHNSLSSGPPLFLPLHQTERSFKVKPSTIHGYGLFTSHFLAKDEFVIEFVGDICNKKMNAVRQKWCEHHNINNYSLGLGARTTIDGTIHGNCSNFINHSCQPNCSFRIVHGMPGSQKQQRVLVMALRDISPDEEITCDYNFNGPSELATCNCGSGSNCSISTSIAAEENGSGRRPRGRPKKMKTQN